MNRLESIKQNYPIGTKVAYFPLKDSAHNEITETRSEPWELPNGEILVKVKGRTGGVSIEHVEAL